MEERGKMGIREVEVDSYENYRQKYPEDQPLSTYKDILENIVKAIPNKTAFIQGDRKLTWKQFDERTNRLTNGLLDLGLKKGDRIAVNGFNSIEWMEAYWAAFKVGIVPVNLNPRFVAEEIKYVLEDSDAVLLVTEDRWIDVIKKVEKDLPLLKHIIVYNAPGYPKKEIPADMIDYEDFMKKYPDSKPKIDWEIKNEDLALFKYTGGTTGYPKGVIFDNWKGCASMKWGMLSTELNSGWNKIVDVITKDRNFMNGVANLVGNMEVPVLHSLLSRIINMFGDMLSGSGTLRAILSSVLRSKAIKRVVFETIIPNVLARPTTYRLLGGRANVLLPVPLFHGLGYDVDMMSICATGATTVYLEPAHPFDAKILWDAVERWRPVLTSVAGDAFVIPMIEELDRAKKEGRPHDTSSLLLIGSSAVRWSPHLKRNLLDHMPQCLIADGYGIAEAPGGYTYISSSMSKDITEHTTPVMDSFGYSAKRLVLDMDTGKEAKPGCKRAQFLYGGTHVALGYWKAPDKSKSTFVDIDGERYVFSGDEGFVDENGGFHLVGRGGGYVINTGGEKVYSEEVEGIIKAHPKVRDVAVIGIPDEIWGEAVTAIVELEPGEKVTEDEMKGYCREKIAGYKIPKNVIFHKIFRTEAGKIERAESIKIALGKLKR